MYSLMKSWNITGNCHSNQIFSHIFEILGMAYIPVHSFSCSFYFVSFIEVLHKSIFVVHTAQLWNQLLYCLLLFFWDHFDLDFSQGTNKQILKEKKSMVSILLVIYLISLKHFHFQWWELWILVKELLSLEQI